MNIDRMVFVQHLAVTTHQNAVQQLIAYAAIDWMLNDFFGPLFLIFMNIMKKTIRLATVQICMFCFSTWKAKHSFLSSFLFEIKWIFCHCILCRWMLHTNCELWFGFILRWDLISIYLHVLIFALSYWAISWAIICRFTKYYWSKYYGHLSHKSHCQILNHCWFSKVASA